jgi:hypothetical protein
MNRSYGYPFRAPKAHEETITIQVMSIFAMRLSGEFCGLFVCPKWFPYRLIISVMARGFLPFVEM